MGNISSKNNPFERAECAANITTRLQNHTMAWDPSIFISIQNISNPILTLSGCEKLCGSDTGWYPDVSPRLIEWFLPIFLLVSNMQFPLIGMERFLLVLHLLGDPIDSTWSLLDKVDSWSRCYSEAGKRLTEKANIKSLAVVDAAREEVEDLSDHRWVETNISNLPLIRKTAITFMRHRTNEILRTSFAVAMYIFQIVSAFVPAVGASSSPSGGKIGPAMLLSWLVSVVLLSNAIGDLGSPCSNDELVAEFMERNGQDTAHESTEMTSKLTLRIFIIEWESKTSREASLVWCGAVYCYRPQKRLGNSGWPLAMVSVLPIAIAFGTAFAVLETGPTYFSCRHLLVIFAFVFWLFSAALSYFLSQASFATGKYLWNIILVKDFFIGAPIIALIVASSCGYWNTCACWGGAFVHGDRTQIQLNPTNVFNLNDDKKYPAMVGICLALQIGVFFVMIGMRWDGFRAMWWSEGEKRMVAELNRSPSAPEDDPEREPRELSCLGMMSKGQNSPVITYQEVKTVV